MKRRHAARRILAFALSVMMVTGLLFTSAFGYDAYAEKKSVTLKNALGREITFLDLYGGKTTGRKDLNDKTTFYGKLSHGLYFLCISRGLCFGDGR